MVDGLQFSHRRHRLYRFLVSEPVDRLLGDTGRTILTRLLGVILAALAVQFVADGVRALVAA